MHSALENSILAWLTKFGVATSEDLQHIFGKSQATISRLLGNLSSSVLRIGAGKSSRYAKLSEIGPHSAQQPVWWTGEDGQVVRIGTVSSIAGNRVHLALNLDEVGAHAVMTVDELPWQLSSLKVQGFLGRIHAQKFPLFDHDPKMWTTTQTLEAALMLSDAPGAISIGAPHAIEQHISLSSETLGEDLDRISRSVATSLPAGSSAGGEQPKFLALLDGREHVLVKMSPPRGTPYGERWSDLLHAEQIASSVLSDAGVAVAVTTVVCTEKRTYLLSSRFDRVGLRGRRHAVALDAVHSAVVNGPKTNWMNSCDDLARQGRLTHEDAQTVAGLLAFGRLIGNTDMHFGNLSLFVDKPNLNGAKFSVCPAYDMLPMRWRPDVNYDDYSVFEPDPLALGSAQAPLAKTFWERVATTSAVSAALRDVAREMAQRMGPQNICDEVAGDEFHRRAQAIPNLQQRAGVSYVFWHLATEAIQAAGGDPTKVEWAQVEDATAKESIGDKGQAVERVLAALCEQSPGAASGAQQRALAWRIQQMSTSLERIFEAHLGEAAKPLDPD